MASANDSELHKRTSEPSDKYPTPNFSSVESTEIKTTGGHEISTYLREWKEQLERFRYGDNPAVILSALHNILSLVVSGSDKAMIENAKKILVETAQSKQKNTPQLWTPNVAQVYGTILQSMLDILVPSPKTPFATPFHNPGSVPLQSSSLTGPHTMVKSNLVSSHGKYTNSSKIMEAMAKMDSIHGKINHSATAAQLNHATSKKRKENTNSEEDNMYISTRTLSNVMKRVIPVGCNITEETKVIMQECLTDFILFVRSEAKDQCRLDNRNAITGKDVISSLDTLGFFNYSKMLRVYEEKVVRALSQPKIPQPVKPTPLTSMATNTTSQQRPFPVVISPYPLMNKVNGGNPFQNNSLNQVKVEARPTGIQEGQHTLHSTSEPTHEQLSVDKTVNESQKQLLQQLQQRQQPSQPSQPSQQQQQERFIVDVVNNSKDDTVLKNTALKNTSLTQLSTSVKGEQKESIEKLGKQGTVNIPFDHIPIGKRVDTTSQLPSDSTLLSVDSNTNSQDMINIQKEINKQVKP